MKCKNHATHKAFLVLVTITMASVAGLTCLWIGTSARAHEQRSPAMTDSKDPLSCASLKNINLPEVHITAADTVDIQSQWGPGGRSRPFDVQHPFCRVQGVIETEIGFELWLPAKEFWNGKFLAGGVGGDAGTFNYGDLSRGILRGYAAATTDTGHKASDTNWMLGDPMRLTNYELRANHLLAVDSKLIISRFYENPIRYSYFIGCSGGGRQALKELQRFPDDYNGIISGARVLRHLK